MGAMQKYFTYKMGFVCGIPSVTLLGNPADWESILSRLEKVPRLGPEPTQFYTLLKPVLTNFVLSCDSPSAPSIVEFWRRIADINAGSGYCHISGWITAFCFWDEDGKSLYAPRGEPLSTSYIQRAWRMILTTGRKMNYMAYHMVYTDSIPAGFASVPVKLDDNGTPYDTVMVAGSVGIHVTSRGDALDDRKYLDVCGDPTGEPRLDSLQPVSGWWIFETDEQQGSQSQVEKPTKKTGEGEALRMRKEDKKREEIIRKYAQVTAAAELKRAGLNH